MNALAIQTIKKSKPLTILQRISEKDQIAARNRVNDFGNVIWLSKQVAVGDETNFVRLYETTSGLMFALLLRLLSDSQKAEEMLKRIYGEFRQASQRFDAGREKSLIWLIGIARRQGIEHLPLDRQFEVFEAGNEKNFPPLRLVKDN